jgi:hypothetical protein
MKKLILISFLLFIKANSFSQQSFKESFTYTENTLLTANGWTAHSGAGTNAIRVSSGLTYAGVSSEGASAILATSGEDINRQITNQISTGTVYVSFLMNISAVQDAGDYFFHLGPKDLGTTFRGKVFVKKSTNGFQIGVTKASNTPTYTITEYELNKTHLVVMKYTFKTASTTDDEVVLFMNPTLDKEPSVATSTTPAGETDSENVGSIALRQGAAANAPSVKVDEIRVGSAWGDLFTSTQSEVITVTRQSRFSEINYSIKKINSPGFYANFGNEEFVYTIRSNTNSIRKVRYKTNYLGTTSSTKNGIDITRQYNNVNIAGVNDQLYLNKIQTETPAEGIDTLQIYVNDKLAYSEIMPYYFILENGNYISISTIKKVGKVLSKLPEFIRGRVSSVNQINDLVYIQDQTGGIPLSLGKSTNLPANLKLALGDSVEVSLATFNYGLESNQAFVSVSATANDTGIKLISGATKQVVPKVIKISELSQNEGNLVSIQNVNFTDKKFVFLPNTNYTINDGSSNAVVRIWESTDIEGRTKPQSAITITGVVGRFNNTFQIYPRSQADIPSTSTFPKATSTVSLDKSIDIAAWNVEWFGNKALGPTDETLQQTNVKRVLDSLKADIYVLTEISNQPAFTDLVAKMTGFKGVCSSAISAGGAADDAQRVCMIYRESAISNVSSRPLLKGTTAIANYPDTFDRFWASGRLPFLFTCDAIAEGGKRKINVIGIHARANTASDIPNAERIYQQRKIDVEVLKDSLDKQFKDEFVILAGDFNDDVDETVVSGISTKESSYKKYVDDTENWQVLTKTLSDNGYRSYISQDNVIDHIAISNELKTSYLQNSVSLELPFTYINNYANTTSDHLPILARFQLQAIPLSTEEVVLKFGNIYPNPSNGNIEFELNEGFKNRDLQFIINDQLGKVLLNEKGTWEDLKIKINGTFSKSSSGIYYLKVADNQTKQTFRVVIK